MKGGWVTIYYIVVSTLLINGGLFSQTSKLIQPRITPKPASHEIL